jgi:hypothetical protein
LLNAASRCRDEAAFQVLLKEYRALKEVVHRQIEFRAPPGPVARRVVDSVSRHVPPLAGPGKYLGYGLWNNFGLRRLFRSFAERWVFPAEHNARTDTRPVRIHLDGEVYMRTTAETILRLLSDHLGYGT